MGHRRDVLDRSDPEAARIERPHGRFASWPGPTDPDLQVLDAALERGTPGRLGRDLAAKGVDLRDP